MPARAGRGVLHARLGRREAAHADARETLRRDSKPFTIYQVAGIYALTSRQEPADRREAFRLLESALNRGFGLDLIDKDRDLDAIRDQPEFRQLVEAAQVAPLARHSAAGETASRLPAASAAPRIEIFGGWDAKNRLLVMASTLGWPNVQGGTCPTATRS